MSKLRGGGRYVDFVTITTSPVQPTRFDVLVTERSALECYWGKTNRLQGFKLEEHDGRLQYEKESAEAVPLRYHLLVCHNLDVAACAKIFVERDPILKRRLAGVLGVRELHVADFVALLLMWHDLGKFSRDFQGLEELLARALGTEPGTSYPVHHVTLGYLAWRDVLHPLMVGEDWFGLSTYDPDADGYDFWDYFDPLAQAVEGHHGRPPRERHHHARQYFVKHNREAVVEFARETRKLVDLDGAFVSWGYDERVPAAQRGSWLLAGFAVLADWIGSNVGKASDGEEQPYFAYCERLPEGGLAAYWEAALAQAKSAVERAGVLPIAASSETSYKTLFPDVKSFDPTPLQAFVLDEEKCLVDEGPHLFILEDATGSGKTEAAIALAHRLMRRGAGHGLYLGLPTMATANAMHGRLGEPAQRLYEDAPSYVLAHSRRAFSEGFRALRLVDATDAERLTAVRGGGKNRADEDQALDEAAQAQCAAWIADHRKKALLADVGVGTIDQALLGALPAKHQSLRLLGLSRNVLIVDEVHAYDEYVSALLATLLRFQAALGGSVILLSATLTMRQRADLCRSFRAGLWPDDGQDPAGRRQALDVKLSKGDHADDFPLVTRCTKNTLNESLPGASRRSEHHVAVEFIEPTGIQGEDVEAAEESVRDRLLGVARAGGCACWIRNTVAQAQKAYETLNDVPDVEVTLFHSRFTHHDRLHEDKDHPETDGIEPRVLRLFGAESTRSDRKGQILIATQVVEQSLDLDFDLLVSDLAPIDLLIQRAGRLHRHERGWRPDSAKKPTLVVFAPAYRDEPHKSWYSEVLGNARFVYPHIGLLWRTARVLRERGRIHIPEDARLLLETAYAPDTPTEDDLVLWQAYEQERGGAFDASSWIVPEALEKACNAALNEMKRARSKAQHNALHVDGGYGSLLAGAAEWYSDKHTPTRLGEPTVTVRLARWVGEDDEAELVPLYCDETSFLDAKKRYGQSDDEERDIARRKVIDAWHGSELTVRQRMVGEEPNWKKAERARLDYSKNEMPDRCRWSVLLVLDKDESGAWSGPAVAKQVVKGSLKDKEVTVTYSNHLGLTVES